MTFMRIQTNSFIVLDTEARQRLDLLLARKYPQINRSGWQERIRDGRVLVNEMQVRPSRRLKEGELIKFSYQQKAEPDVDKSYSIIYEDQHLYVINKPANLPVHPSGIYNDNTLTSLLKKDRTTSGSIHLIHRLDRETSGLIILAQNREAAARLHDVFRNSQVHKEYLVLIEGDFPEYLDARGILSRDYDSAVRKKRRYFPDGEPPFFGPGKLLEEDKPQTCRTEFHRLHSFSPSGAPEMGRVSLLKAVLHTGRLHQIRATLQSLGFPVVGDRMYGVDSALYLEWIEKRETQNNKLRLRLKRTALHCRRLEFKHPFEERLIQLEAKLPADMADFLPKEIKI